MNRIKVDRHTWDVIGKSFRSTLVKVAALMVGLLLSILMGRHLGAAGVGTLALANKVLAIAILFSVFGMRSMLVKDVSAAHHKQNGKEIFSAMRNSYIIVSVSSFIVSLCLIFSSPWLANSVFNDGEMVVPLLLGFVFLPTQSMTQLFFAGAVALKRNWQATLIDQLANLAITTTTLILLIACHYEVTVPLVAICYAIGRLGAFIIGAIYWKKIFSENHQTQIEIARTAKIAMPFMIVSVSASVANGMDVLVLGYMSGSHELGIYSVVSRIALMSAFFLVVVSTAVSPKVSAFYSSGELHKLQAMLSNVTFILMVMGLLALIFFGVAGKAVLAVWGEEFVSGYPSLMVLVFGQFISLATGVAGTVLVMTGNEKRLINMNLSYIGFNVVLLFIMTAMWDELGAAIAMAISVSVFNIWKVIEVRKRTGILMLPKLSLR